MPEPSRFWEVPPDDVAPAVTNTPTPKRAAAADLRQAAERRWQVHERALQALAGTSLPTDAAEAIPWGTVARQAAVPTAQAFYTIFRMTQHTAAVLRHAGITIEKQADLTTPEAKLALAQAKADGVTFGPEDPDVLHDLTQQQTNILMIEFDRNAALRRRAATLLLIEAWVSLAPGKGGDNAAITAAITAALAEPEGWEWLAGFPLDVDSLTSKDGDRDARQPLEPHTSPAFNDDGIGYVLSSGVTRHIWRAVVEPQMWEDHEGQPIQRFQGSGANGYLSVDHDNTAAAWMTVHSLGDIPADIFMDIVLTIVANRGRPQSPLSFGYYISRDQVLDDLGMHKHKRAYRPADVKAVVDSVETLIRLKTRGVRDTYQSRKKVAVPFEGPVLIIHDIVPRLTSPHDISPFLAGETSPHSVPEGIAGWHISLGSWAGDLTDKNHPLALVAKTLLGYSKTHQSYMRRLGFALTFAFRNRKNERNWEQPHRVRNLLRDACISLDKRNPARTITKVHEALDQLRRDGIIGTACYKDAPQSDPLPIPANRTKGWVEGWLDRGLIITPPDRILAAYDNRNSQALTTRKPKAVAS